MRGMLRKDCISCILDQIVTFYFTQRFFIAKQNRVLLHWKKQVRSLVLLGPAGGRTAVHFAIALLPGALVPYAGEESRIDLQLPSRGERGRYGTAICSQAAFSDGGKLHGALVPRKKVSMFGDSGDCLSQLSGLRHLARCS